MFPVEQIFWYWFDQWWDLCDRQRRAMEILRERQQAAPAAPSRDKSPPRQPRLVVDNTRR
ncbi:MAG TPA: hypothetical protein VFG12_13890 [Rhodopila sp.]|nr:hypothetical protein [Rhodopila sp.]